MKSIGPVQLGRERGQGAGARVLRVSSALDISDAVSLLDTLFRGAPGRNCQDAGDANDDGALDISDGVFVLLFLFGGGEAPPEPFPDPGTDPTPDGLSCLEGLN